MVGYDDHEQNFFLGSIQLDQKEWDAFLEQLSELEKKYLLVLRELDEARSKLQALIKSSHQTEQTLTGPAAPTIGQPSEKVGRGSKDHFMTRLKAKLGPPQPPSTVVGDKGQTVQIVKTAQGSYASCGRCGYRLSHATNRCEGCGANFGRLVCSCGRDVPESGRFCDGCGRAVK